MKGTPNEKKERQSAFRLNVWCWWWDLEPALRKQGERPRIEQKAGRKVMRKCEYNKVKGTPNEKKKGKMPFK